MEQLIGNSYFATCQEKGEYAKIWFRSYMQLVSSLALPLLVIHSNDTLLAYMFVSKVHKNDE